MAKQNHIQKIRSEYTPIRRSSQDKEEEKAPDEMPELQTEKNQLAPPEKAKTMPARISIELRMPGREHSSIRKRRRGLPPSHRSPDIARSPRRQIGKDSTGRRRHPG